jgi:hypothetical protein
MIALLIITCTFAYSVSYSNYGGAYFAIDRLFGTYVNPEQYHAEKAAKEAAKLKNGQNKVQPKEDRLMKDFGHILGELNQDAQKAKTN